MNYWQPWKVNRGCQRWLVAKFCQVDCGTQPGNRLDVKQDQSQSHDVDWIITVMNNKEKAEKKKARLIKQYN